MKSFKEYLIESKQCYEFKIKFAGEPSDDAIKRVKEALEQFNIESFSEGKRTPIQETQVDFPDHKNINVTVYDISLSYPVTSSQLRNIVAEAANLTQCCVKIRNLKEQEEEEINHEHDEKSDKVLLNTDYEKENNQDLVGDKHAMGLLKELSKTKHRGEQYKGINDKLLAKKAPSEKSASLKADKEGSNSVIGSKKVSLPDPYKGK